MFIGGLSPADPVMPPVFGPFSLDQAIRAVELVRERLLRSTAALEAAGIPYAVAGGHAVALWVSRVDPAAVRNTADVDLLVRRADLEAIKVALTAAGFVYRHAASIDMFLDGPTGRAREAVHLVFAGEFVKAGEPVAAPNVEDSEVGPEFRVLALAKLVEVKLTAYRDKDRTHLRDMIDVGIVDATWVGRYPPELAARLQHLLDTPGG